jgi:hypothetical protein
MPTPLLSMGYSGLSPSSEGRDKLGAGSTLLGSLVENQERVVKSFGLQPEEVL